MGFGKHFARQDFATAIGVRQSAPPQVDSVEFLLCPVGQRDQPTGGRFDHPGNVEDDIMNDSSRNLLHARNLMESRSQADRCPLECGKDIGESIISIIVQIGHF